MKTKTKLLALAAALMLALGMGAMLIQMNQNKVANPPTPNRVACIGDSLTIGSEYPNDLWMKLGPNYTIGNFGVGGAAVSFDSKTPYINQSEFKKAQEFQPNIVIIMLGTNDAFPGLSWDNETFKNDYLMLIHSFQVLASKPRLFIVVPPPIFNDGTGLSTQIFDSRVVPAIEDVAKIADLPLVNVYSALIDHPESFVDGVHPNLVGSQIIADVVYNAIA
jgi:acyl-CoA thioesterase-1